MVAVEWYVRTARFFSARPVEQNKRSQSLVWVSTPQRGKPVLFLFSDLIIVGLKSGVIYV